MSVDDMKEMLWTKPKLVAQIRFVDWTAENRLTHSKFLTLRSDSEANWTSLLLEPDGLTAPAAGYR